MPGDRRQRILKMLHTNDDPERETRRLCEVCAEITGTSGAGIMLMSGDVSRGSICTTNDTSAIVEQLQYDLGEGPCIDAHKLRQPVLEPDLMSPTTPRWLAFTGPAIDAGVRAIFGFPLQIGAVCLGALNLYNDEAGSLTDEQYANALAVADVATHAVLNLQVAAAPGQLAANLEADANFQHVVHQASGMVSAQLDISVAKALIRLRAHAFGNDRPLTEVAKDVVARRLRFDADSSEDDEAP